MAITIQTNAHQYNNQNIENYSLMMGGLNVTHDVLQQYDPLITGYGRLFMVRKPMFVQKLIPDQMKRFKHILEYGNTAVTGFSDVSLDTTDLTGGYAGRTFKIPTVTKDDMTAFNVKTYEFSGSPIRELIYTWINGISDQQSGLAHYGGLIASGKLEYKQANHTAEFIYVVTDRTGMKVEYACMLANCIPTKIMNSQWETTAGEHNHVEYDIEFTCTKYEGADINAKAKQLLENYQILVSSLEFNSGLETGEGTVFGTQRGYDSRTGTLKDQSNISYRTSVHAGDGTATDLDSLNKTTPSWTNAGNTHGE